MDISSNYGKNSFEAVRMSPEPAKWDQRVLKAVLNSQRINKIVKDDAENGKDTIISYYKNYDPPFPECPAHRDIFLSVEGGNDSINLETRSTYWFIPGSFFRKPREIQNGPEDIGADLAYKIRNLDPPETDNQKGPQKTLEDLRQLASEIIYEDAKPVE